MRERDCDTEQRVTALHNNASLRSKQPVTVSLSCLWPSRPLEPAHTLTLTNARAAHKHTHTHTLSLSLSLSLSRTHTRNGCTGGSRRASIGQSTWCAT